MTTPTGRPREPRWARAPRLLERVVLGVVAVAATVDAVTLVAWGAGPASWAGLALVVGGVALLRRLPVATLVLVAAGPVVDALLDSDPTALWSMGCFVAFLLALQRMPGLVTGVVIGAANVLAVGLAGGSIDVAANPGASIAGFAALVAAATGSAVRGHRRYWFELEQRAREAVATRETAVERSIARERVRIARDLHDSVGHRIAVVSMHLGSAEVHLPAGADTARAELRAARGAVQEVLRETQQILRVLRDGSDDDGLAPTPDHRRIGDLVASYRAAGLVVEATLPEDPPELPADVSAAAHRIAQEALTNAQRHGTGPVSITVALTDDELVVEVVNVRRPDDAQAPAEVATGGGNGLVGMRERAESTGGRLTAGPDGRLFWVRAVLPAPRALRR